MEVGQIKRNTKDDLKEVNKELRLSHHWPIRNSGFKSCFEGLFSLMTMQSLHASIACHTLSFFTLGIILSQMFKRLAILVVLLACVYYASANMAYFTPHRGMVHSSRCPNYCPTVR